MSKCTRTNRINPRLAREVMRQATKDELDQATERMWQQLVQMGLIKDKE